MSEHSTENDTGLTARDFDLIEVALDSAANSIQSGATLENRGIDPLAREYLTALAHVERLRARVIPPEKTAQR